MTTPAPLSISQSGIEEIDLLVSFEEDSEYDSLLDEASAKLARIFGSEYCRCVIRIHADDLCHCRIQLTIYMEQRGLPRKPVTLVGVSGTSRRVWDGPLIRFGEKLTSDGKVRLTLIRT